jgi:hypothetical protein
VETQVRTPQMVFMQPQRLVVPLFQRPYVWNEENQWEPLWNDVARTADRVLRQPAQRQQPHFLGAVVLQQMQNPIGLMQTRTIIDGQQRLTTLQLLLDALHGELMNVGAEAPAARLEALVANAAPFCAHQEDRFKVWPTNRDRPAFNAVMGAAPPVNYDALGFAGERIVEAHRFFGQEARQWLTCDGPESVPTRAAAVETVVRELLQMVVIDLAAEENAQEIFETLNARGAQLTAADLIKNFVFQRLQESGADVDAAYRHYWREFETGFWEMESSVGRVKYPRSSLFLNHWLVARTGEEILAREVFERFKRFADQDAGTSMPELLSQVHRASERYKAFIEGASRSTGAIDRLALFGYRTGVLESEVIKPLVLHLVDGEQPRIPGPQFIKALDVVESWMVRRMLVRATTKSYGQVVAELISRLQGEARLAAGDTIERYFSDQSGANRYWPDDGEVRDELSTLLAYRRMGRGRLRMVLEAVEDYQRGWRNGKDGLGGERVARGKLVIEHVMPRKWQTNWPLTNGDEAERDRLVHTLGNLTLLTGRLNSKVSNGPWLGAGGKRDALQGHDVFLLNRALVDQREWSDDAIRKRTTSLIDDILRIWPVPHGHKSGFVQDKPQRRRRIQLIDLLNGGVLEAGMPLYPRRKKFADRIATLLSDGRVDVDGEAFPTPGAAARKIAGKGENGWWFFLVDRSARISLRDVWRKYVDALAVDAEDDDAGDEVESDDEE